MITAILPGSYDPITVGHLDIIKRASDMYDEVIVLIAKNSAKNYTLCSKSRLALAEDAVKDLKNVRCDVFDGFVVDYAARFDKAVFVKGLRNETDFSYEKEMAAYNAILSEKKYGKPLETVYLDARPAFAAVSSTLVRTLLSVGGSIDEYVPNASLLLSLIQS